jgi:hypothetical protein
VYLLRCHRSQVLHTHQLLGEMLALKELIATSVDKYRGLVGVNATAVRSMKRQWDQMQEDGSDYKTAPLLRNVL